MSAADWPLLGVLALCWLAYFALHSALAARRVKHWVAAHHAAALPAYRIAYNGVALLTLLPIGGLIASHRGPALWAWTGAAAWLANVLALAALGAFALTLRSYDGQAFLGLRQWSARRRRGALTGALAPDPGLEAAGDAGEDSEAFRLSPLHRYVRHPWYSLSLVLIWTRDMDAVTLVSALMISAYFVIGARLEEAKLVHYHGAVYRRYMARVGGLIPRPWKTLSARDAAALEAAARPPPGDRRG